MRRPNPGHITGWEILILLLCMAAMCFIDPSSSDLSQPAPMITRAEAQR